MAEDVASLLKKEEVEIFKLSWKEFVEECQKYKVNYRPSIMLAVHDLARKRRLRRILASVSTTVPYQAWDQAAHEDHEYGFS